MKDKPTLSEIKTTLVEIMADLYFNFKILLRLPKKLKDK